MINKKDFSIRLEELMTFYSISASTLADKIGIQRSSISHLLSGRNKPSLDFILKILANFPEIHFDWLVKGQGSIDASTVNTSDNSHTPTLFDETTVDREPITTQKKTVSKKSSTKEIEKILILYTDGSFEHYIP